MNVPDDIGKWVSFDSKNHPSICKIMENLKEETSFSFSCVDEGKVSKLIDKLQVKKATGKIIKLGKPVLQSPLDRLDELAPVVLGTYTFRPVHGGGGGGGGCLQGHPLQLGKLFQNHAGFH